jgi:hypothetical protein
LAMADTLNIMLPVLVIAAGRTIAAL